MLTSKTICIVGAGTAGALTAATIAKEKPEYKVILIQGKSFSPMEVGESTNPVFCYLLDKLGILEEFFYKVNCSPKYGVKFYGWTDKLFVGGWPLFMTTPHSNNSFLYSLRHRLPAVGRIPSTIDAAELIPYDKINDTFYSIVTLHVPAKETYEFIINKFKDKLTVIEQDVVQVNRDIDNVESVILSDGTTINADEWIDCTGFKRLLITDTSFKPFTLPINSAIAAWTDNENFKENWTVSKTAKAGWIWKFKLRNKLAAGYVFCNTCISTDEAMAEIEDYLSVKTELTTSLITFTSGMLTKPKKGNVTAIGLSAGFIDALESTTIQTICLSIFNWLDYENEDTYNEKWNQLFKEITSYIYLYYKLSNEKSVFWNSIKKLSDDQIRKMFFNLLQPTNNQKFQTEAFSRFIKLRLLASKLKLNDELANLIDNNSEYKKSYEIVNTVKYHPYSDELMVKWLKYSASFPARHLHR